MGIKGIYQELGSGKRVSLSKLAADNLKHQGRPFRVAIDIAIWQFQTQAARGGTNPAIRTLFYRLVRLLGTPIEPVFVFDGPHKPAIKRNKRSGRGDGVATSQAKRLIQLFGFPVHDAPGEAEAECALLQRHGVVDAVLSEDVDTIMFGCTKTLRNWSAEGKSSKTPTHVSLYDVEGMNIAEVGLDREGMVLVALMSGGDYLPEGIPGCGVKVACEAARAGFGKSLCRLKASDKVGIRSWKDKLTHELQTNEAGYFRTKHKALVIPEEFPNMEVCGYYTHPAVSPSSAIDDIRVKMHRKQSMHLESLREFTRETFGWDFREGAIKFIRVLSQALLVHKIRQQDGGEEEYVKRITGRRTHFSTDATPELRLAYTPEEVVPIDLSKEVDEHIPYAREGLALNSDDAFDEPAETAESVDDPKQAVKSFDITKPDLAWVLEEVARKFVPVSVREWEDAERVKAVRKSPTKRKAAAKPKKKTDMPQGALDMYVRVTKATDNIIDIPPKLQLAQNEFSLKAQSHRQSILPIRPREPSKQSSPSPTRSPTEPAVEWIQSSSPVTPRSNRVGGDSEAIVISSSPAAPSTPSSPSPASRCQRAAARVGEVPDSIHTIVSSSKQAKQPLPATAQAPEARETSTITLRTLRQMSIFEYTKKSRPAADPVSPEESVTNEVEAISKGDHESKADLPNLEPPSFTTHYSPNKARPLAHDVPSSPPHFSPGPSRKKKVLVPGAAKNDPFTEVAVSADKYDAVITQQDKHLRTRGVKTNMPRWSDVSMIDLTEGN